MITYLRYAEDRPLLRSERREVTALRGQRAQRQLSKKARRKVGSPFIAGPKPTYHGGRIRVVATSTPSRFRYKGRRGLQHRVVRGDQTLAWGGARPWYYGGSRDTLSGLVQLSLHNWYDRKAVGLNRKRLNQMARKAK